VAPAIVKAINIMPVVPYDIITKEESFLPLTPSIMAQIALLRLNDVVMAKNNVYQQYKKEFAKLGMPYRLRGINNDIGAQDGYEAGLNECRGHKNGRRGIESMG
ncbi:MAG: hypothetical protein ACE5HI_07420, partial [bacterium]